LVFSITLSAASALAQDKAKAAPKAQSGGDMGAVGHKLANPLANLWSLSMNFETPKAFDGDVNTGDPKYGADMIFQPVMPIPLHGTGDAQCGLSRGPSFRSFSASPSRKGSTNSIM
jgi:hypothetical protein